MSFTFNDFVRVAKKLFKFWKKYQAQQQQQQQQQGHGGQPQQGGYGGQQQQPQHGQSPYPQHAPQQQPWQSSPYPPAHGGKTHGGQVAGGYAGGGGGFGAHDGPATNADMANAQNAHYVDLRNRAIREGDLMGQCFEASRNAYSSGDGGRAHDLSMEGKQHQREKDRLNAEAAEWIYRENNKVQPQGTIDLHGLYVQEAIEYTEKGIADARQRNMPELRVIVGKGNHSPSHVAKIKPAIASLMERERLTASLDPHNGGVLVVQLQGQGGGRGAGQFLREMEQSRDNDCVVM